MGRLDFQIARYKSIPSRFHSYFDQESVPGLQIFLRISIGKTSTDSLQVKSVLTEFTAYPGIPGQILLIINTYHFFCIFYNILNTKEEVYIPEYQLYL